MIPNTPPGCVRATRAGGMERCVRWRGLRSYLTPRVKAKGLPSAQHPWECRPKCWKPIWVIDNYIYFWIPNMLIHNFDAFSGKPFTEKVCLSLWLVVWDSSALFLTDEVQPADTNWSYPSLQPYGHRGLQLKLSQTHLEDGDTLKSLLNQTVKGNRC